jgi:hypothetical protein
MKKASTTQRPRKKSSTVSGLSPMAEFNIVKSYLELIHSPIHKGTAEFRNPEAQLKAIETELENATTLPKKLDLIQRRIDILEFIESRNQKRDSELVETKFVSVAKSYSQRKRISYAAWREMGVPARVLKEAKIERRQRGE